MVWLPGLGMTKIKIVGSKKSFESGRLYLNGELVEKAYLVYGPHKTWSVLDMRDERARDQLLKMPIEQLRKKIGFLAFNVNDCCHPFVDECFIGFQEDGVHIQFGSTYGLESWKQPYTVRDFCDTITRIGSSFVGTGVEATNHKEDDACFYTLTFTPVRPAARLLDEFVRHAQIAREILDRVMDDIHAAIPADALVVHFRFPREFQPACAQYLLYFTQFLNDLGMRATAEVKEEAHRVLFTVTPASGPEALQWVQEALVAYLKLPSLPSFGVGLPEPIDVAVAQLEDNIRHLSAQLELAGSAMALKDATIGFLELTNFKYREMLRTKGAYAETNVPSAGDKSSDGEPLIGDLVSVTKFRIKGIEVNLPELLRKLKRMWRR
jgi:hypothetical protein